MIDLLFLFLFVLVLCVVIRTNVVFLVKKPLGPWWDQRKQCGVRFYFVCSAAGRQNFQHLWGGGAGGSGSRTIYGSRTANRPPAPPPLNQLYQKYRKKDAFGHFFWACGGDHTTAAKNRTAPYSAIPPDPLRPGALRFQPPELASGQGQGPNVRRS